MGINRSDLCKEVFGYHGVPQKALRIILRSLRGRMLGPVFCRYRPGNVVMFHIGRCGSSVLGNLLDQHPKIYWDGEIYRPFLKSLSKKSRSETGRLPIDPLKYVQKRMTLAGGRFYGCEVKFFHLDLFDSGLAEYIEGLEDLGFGHFIILERKNYLRKVVSSIIGHNKSRFHQPSHRKAELNRIMLDPTNVSIDSNSKRLVDYLQTYEDRYKTLKKLLSHRNALHLTYEDHICLAPMVAYHQVCHFLGIDDRRAVVHYGRSNPFKLNKIVTNYDEVRSSLKGTGFEWMTDE